MFNNLRAHQGGYPNPTVAAKFAQSANDFTTLLTTTSMPTGGSISRSGQAMVYDSTGKLTYAPNNLLFYSNTFSNAYWSQDGATISNANAVSDPFGGTQASTLTAVSGNKRLLRNVGAFANTQQINSIWIKRRTGTGTISFWTPAEVTTDITSQVTSSWTQISLKGDATVTNYFNLIIGTVGDAVDIYGATVSSVTYETAVRSGDQVITTTAAYYGPRFDYDPSTLAAKGLLIEGTRTNRCPASCVPTGFGWAASGVTVNSTNNAAPDGTNTASNLTMTTSAYMYGANYAVANGTYTVTVSAWLSGAAGTKVAWRVVDAAAGTSGGTQIITLTTTPTRYTFTTTVVVTGGSGIMHGLENRAGVVPGLPGVAATFTLWGYQLEDGAFATSFIYTPNSNTTATRAAETFSITGYSSNLINATYIDEATGVTSTQPYNAGTAPSPSFSWLTSLRAYTNAYAGSIASPSWLSFSRSGNAMMTDSTGKLTYAPANQLTYSNGFDTIAAWPVQGYKAFGSGSTVNATTAPDGTTTAANLVCSTSTTQIGPYQISAVLASTYIMSIYVKANTGVRYLQLSYPATQPSTDYANFDLNTGTITAGTYAGAAMQSVGNGWYRISMTSNTAANANGGIWLTFISTATAARAATYAGNGTDAVYIWGAQLERVTYQTQPSAYIPTTTAAVYGPRYDYDASTVPATPRGLLIEESRANLYLSSQAVSTWGAYLTGVTATGNVSATTAPDGTNTATLLVPTANPAQFGRAATAASGNYTVSIYAKATDATNCWIGVYNLTAGGVVAYFNVNNGTLGTVNSGYTGTITSVGNGWYRISLTQTAAVANPAFYANIYSGNGGTAPVINGSSGVYLWGAQGELGSFATSYIPTTSASVTRAADVAQLTGSALTTLQGANASLGIEYYYARNGCLWDLEPVAAGTFLTMSAQGGSGTGWYLFGLSTMTAPTLNAVNRQFIGWNKTGNFSGSTNSSTTVSSSACDYTGSSTSSYLGSRSGGSISINSYIRSLAIYNQKLPDAILKQKSAINAPY